VELAGLEEDVPDCDSLTEGVAEAAGIVCYSGGVEEA
jgi:hypothetical protein